MPIQLQTLDDRSYDDLKREALARIPVHNPEWTNFNESDPGVTLIELFAFLTENLLYRSNQIPDRNRRKFLQLLGVQLQAATSARGLITFTNESGAVDGQGIPQTITLNSGLEVRAGQVPFRTEQGLDVLPVEARVYYKKQVQDDTAQTLTTYYKKLYASYNGQYPNFTPTLYESVPFPPPTKNSDGVDLSKTVDSSLWIALLVRARDAKTAKILDRMRAAIAGKTLNLGIVPFLTNATRVLPPGGQNTSTPLQLLYQLPAIDATSSIPVARYTHLDATTPNNVLAEPGVVQINLPSDPQALITWNNFAPLEAGTGDFPPALDDTNLNDRLITWIRISPPSSVRKQIKDSPSSLQVKIFWIGINTAFVSQRTQVANELLPTGTGEPDQSVTLAKTPVIAGSVNLSVTYNGETTPWTEINDLLAAGPEVLVPDLRLPPGATSTVPTTSSKVFMLTPESGEIRFGDGTHGARPPFGAVLRADYAYGVGTTGNVGADTITSSPVLPAGIKVTNPVRTWDGADAETVSQGEKQIPRYLQHRDRLVNTLDFETITLRTPGVDIGRVEVLPTYNPELAPNRRGDAAGAVTLMVIPRYDPNQPDAPQPDRLFLDTICEYLNPRRLVTTEVFLRGPDYVDIWVSIGLEVVAWASFAVVREAVKTAIKNFLMPLPADPQALLDYQTTAQITPQATAMQRGWPLEKEVQALELLAVASRVPGVLLVKGVQLAQGTLTATPSVPMSGLQLPRLLGISVALGQPTDINEVRGSAAASDAPASSVVAIPVIPEECR